MNRFFPAIAGVLFLVFLPFSGQGQLHITYEADNKPLAEIITELGQRYDLNFSFSKEQLDTNRVSVSATDEDLTSFLNRLLAPYHLTVQQSKGNFYYIEKEKRRIVILLNDQESGEQIPFATVNVKGSRMTGYTDMEGKAIFMADYDDERIISVQSLGYKAMDIPLADLSSDTLRIPMEYEFLELPEVRIEYQNSAIQLKALSEVHIDPKDMKVLPGLPEADILLSTQLIPGIESNDETASGINVRGGNKDELLTYWDRIPVYQQAHFFGTLTSFIPTTVDQLTAYKNYIPSSFTGSTSGLIDIQVRDSIPQAFEALSNTNFTHSDLLLSIPITSKLGAIAAGRWSYTHIFNSPTFNAFNNKLYSGSRQEDILAEVGGDPDEEEEEDLNAFSSDTDMRYSDLNLKIMYQPSPRDYLSFSGILNNDTYDFFATNTESDQQTTQLHEVQFDGFNIYYRREWDSTWSSTLSFSQSNYALTNNAQEQFDEDEEYNFVIENNLTNNELKAQIRRKTSNRLFSFGYQLNRYENKTTYQEQNTFEGNIADTSFTTLQSQGIFTSYEQWGGNRWKINPQLRIDFYQTLDEVEINPVVNAQLRVEKNTWSKLSYGHYSQALRLLNESDLNVSNIWESVWLLSSTEEELEIIRSRQLSLGFLYEKFGLLIDVDGYYKRTFGNSLLDQFQTVEDDLSFLTGESTAIGVDLMIKKKFGRYQQWLSYSLSQTSQLFEDLSSEPFLSSIDRPHQLRWVHNYYYNQFEFSLGLIAKSGTPYTRPSGITEIDEEEDEFEIQYQDWNSSRLPVYHRLDFSAWYKFPKHKKRRITGMIGVSILNLYNRQNVWRRFYILEDLDDNDEPELTEEERYFLGFTPNITLKLHFK